MNLTKKKRKNKKHCIIATVGASSLHQQWIKGENAFDLHLIVYDDSYELFKLDTPFITVGTGNKFKLIYNYLKNNERLIDQYDFFYMPDDDISIDQNNIQKLFDFMENYELDLAQPAIANSYFSHPHTLRKANSLIRFTNFVEIMQPCFSRDALRKVLHTFNESKSGWGLDFHWGIIVNYTEFNMAIIDDIYSLHTRPVQSSNHQEMLDYMKKYNLSFKIYST
ncbi:DUF707 domain-containing protein [Flavobacterium chungangense]|jgi:hypothetical protein|uniref:DUF707 domain-containing protein n=1 Tax=Flavobacterium chungangense TaxID=554283 RepID=A0A6V6YY86_9FLAO|nr:DUF707 domain-containing protein [Flavobacterium chungangense]CAD0004385.1 hypothetical protein FLACHUCJ7_01841 [Flavobacterium chungangense]